MVTAPVSEMSKYIPSSENEHQSKYKPWIQLIHPRLYMDEEEKGWFKSNPFPRIVYMYEERDFLVLIISNIRSWEILKKINDVRLEKVILICFED